jgi:hypothetical protein
MINDFDEISEGLTDALKFVKPYIGKLDNKKDIHKILKNGIAALNNNDAEAMGIFKKSMTSLKKEAFKKHKDSIPDFKKWQ